MPLNLPKYPQNETQASRQDAVRAMGTVITHVSEAARRFPEKPALICVPGDLKITYGKLEALANQAAHAYRHLGLQQGDCITICLPNGPTFVAAMLGAQRSGLYYTLVSPKASDGDVAFIANDSVSRILLIESDRAASVQSELCGHSCRIVSSAAAGAGWETLLAAQSQHLPLDPVPGMEMIYSSGTTGRPKGVRKPFITQTWGVPDPRNLEAARGLGVTTESVYLSTSPLYHSAPHRYLCTFLNAGATIVLMNRFDASLCLKSIDRFACTHSVLVPTMFHRLLKLDETEKSGYSGRTLTHAVHGAAPCPAHVKRAMIDWWGPVLIEYYSGTEGIGRTLISSKEWLAHPGSVGLPRGCAVHIVDELGSELPVGQIGSIYFESEITFDYWRDPAKTQSVTSPQGWRTFGDVGYLDADGYLYLTDRKGFMVISGGVNVYPQEVENTLLSHPDVLDAAVFGVPDEDLGERLVAVVQLIPGAQCGESKAAELKAFCKAAGGAVKTPKQIEFRSDFPRLDTGKVQKSRLREQYLDGQSSAPMKMALR